MQPTWHPECWQDNEFNGPWKCIDERFWLDLANPALGKGRQHDEYPRLGPMAKVLGGELPGTCNRLASKPGRGGLDGKLARAPPRVSSVDEGGVVALEGTFGRGAP